MGKIFNKRSKDANVEAIAMVNVSLASTDYVTRSTQEHFGLLLREEGTVKLEFLDGTEATVLLPAGYNPVAAVKIFKVGTTATNIVAYY